jgi:hypothetical protein
MLSFILSCTPPQISVWGEVYDTDNVEIEWAEIIYRSEETAWDDTWTKLPLPNPEQTLSKTPLKLTEHTLPATSFVHLFTDAKNIVVDGQMLEDIIEPISCPIPAYGRHKITITYIVIETEIFAMDCIVD